MKLLHMEKICISLALALIIFPFKGYNTDLFCIPNHYVDAVGNVLIPYGKYFSGPLLFSPLSSYNLGMIQDRIEKLGRDVFYDMLSTGREPLHALCVLKVNPNAIDLSSP